MASIHDSIYYPYYRHLQDTQKRIYDLIFPAIEKAEKEIKINIPATSNDAFQAVKAIYNDHPELFHMDGSCQTTTISGKVVSIFPGYNNLVLNLSKKKVELMKVAESYAKGVSGQSIILKEQMIHDRMVREVSYKFGPHDQTAYAALIEKKAVCAGYSRAFQLIMQKVGIPCYYVSGVATNSKGSTESHAWNILRVNGEWVNMDVTWNDAFEKVMKDVIDYTYFNCTDATISKNHKRDKECLFLPKCTSNKYVIEKVLNVASKELLQIVQSGVTKEKPVESRLDFINTLLPELKRSKKGKFKVSFPVHGKAIIEKAGVYFKEAMGKPGVYKGSWKYSSEVVDFKNEWYRMEFEISFL